MKFRLISTVSLGRQPRYHVCQFSSLTYLVQPSRLTSPPPKTGGVHTGRTFACVVKLASSLKQINHNSKNYLL